VIDRTIMPRSMRCAISRVPGILIGYLYMTGIIMVQNGMNSKMSLFSFVTSFLRSPDATSMRIRTAKRASSM